MPLSRFPYEQSEWHSGADSARWLDALERYGSENVRSVLYGPYRDTGSRADLVIGTVQMTKGFAQEWLAWHDRQNFEKDAAFRSTQIYWTRWAALAATVVAAAGVIGWAVTIWLSVKK
jgi:hypothetical protein